MAINDWIKYIYFYVTLFFNKRTGISGCFSPYCTLLNDLKHSYKGSRHPKVEYEAWKKKNNKMNAYEFRMLEFSTTTNSGPPPLAGPI